MRTQDGLGESSRSRRIRVVTKGPGGSRRVQEGPGCQGRSERGCRVVRILKGL